MQYVNNHLFGRTMMLGRRFYSKSTLNIFDRKAKKLQRDRAASLEGVDVFDYLKAEVGYRVADRVLDIKRNLDTVVDLGCGRGYVTRHLSKNRVKNLKMIEMCEGWLKQAIVPDEVSCEKILLDEENFQLDENSVDLLMSSLSIHWINDLPGVFKRIFNSLKTDGAFINAMFGGQTLYELRCSLQLAELERKGGFSPHVSPFTEVQDVGALLSQAGFTLLTIDTDELTVWYPSMFELLGDIKGMGENNAAWNRNLHLGRDTLITAASIYKEMYGVEKKVPATFQVIYSIGWKPDPSQPQPAERGSGNVSLKDLGNLESILQKP